MDRATFEQVKLERRAETVTGRYPENPRRDHARVISVPFSQAQADAACNFFEHILKHTADEWYGKPFLLVPWQEEALSAIFGRDRRSRKPRYRNGLS